LFALACLTAICFGLTSCTDDKNENGGGQITNDTKFVLNASNVASVILYQRTSSNYRQNLDCISNILQGHASRIGLILMY
jgi:hypothetical protein